jgi:hypothetical protein
MRSCACNPGEKISLKKFVYETHLKSCIFRKISFQQSLNFIFEFGLRVNWAFSETDDKFVCNNYLHIWYTYYSPKAKGNFHSLSIRVHVWFGLVWFCLINFVFCFGLIRCITGNRKKNGFSVLPSHKIIVQKSPVLDETLKPAVRSSWVVWNKLRLLYVLCLPSLSSPPHRWSFWYAGRAIYIECWGKIPQYTVLLSSVFWHTGSHLIIIFIISNFISLLLLTPKKNYLNLL